MKCCIIGLGLYGTHLARALTRLGAEVLAVDRNPERVDALKDEVAHALVADTTEVRALRQLPFRDFDAVVVAIGDDFESSLLTIGHLQEMNLPRLVCRSINPVHERLLRLLNVPRTILPEQMAAERTARSLILGNVADVYTVSADFEIVELPLPTHLAGMRLKDVALRNRYQLNLVTLKRPAPEAPGGFEVLGIIPPEYTFRSGDILVLFGKQDDIRRFLED